MNNNHYILDEKDNPVVTDLMTWARWFQTANRSVGLTEIGPYQISTVFLGLDHNYAGGPPVLWETMIFTKKHNDPLDQQQTRCSGSREQAEAMHDKMVKLVKEKYGRRKTKARKSTRP